MHGQWTMDLHLNWGTADFAADMTMSGFGRTPTANAVDPTQPLVNPHTHHIRLTNVRITWNMIGCPPYATPTQQGLSGERHGQPADREWKQRLLRDESAFLDAAGLRHRSGTRFRTRYRLRTLRCCSEGPRRLSISGRNPSMASYVSHLSTRYGEVGEPRVGMMVGHSGAGFDWACRNAARSSQNWFSRVVSACSPVAIRPLLRRRPTRGVLEIRVELRRRLTTHPLCFLSQSGRPPKAIFATNGLDDFKATSTPAGFRSGPAPAPDCDGPRPRCVPSPAKG